MKVHLFFIGNWFARLPKFCRWKKLEERYIRDAWNAAHRAQARTNIDGGWTALAWVTQTSNERREVTALKIHDQDCFIVQGFCVSAYNTQYLGVWAIALKGTTSETQVQQNEWQMQDKEAVRMKKTEAQRIWQATKYPTEGKDSAVLSMPSKRHKTTCFVLHWLGEYFADVYWGRPVYRTSWIVT